MFRLLIITYRLITLAITDAETCNSYLPALADWQWQVCFSFLWSVGLASGELLTCAKNVDKNWNITVSFIIHVNFDHAWAEHYPVILFNNNDDDDIIRVQHNSLIMTINAYYSLQQHAMGWIYNVMYVCTYSFTIVSIILLVYSAGKEKGSCCCIGFWSWMARMWAAASCTHSLRWVWSL